jgi:hemolysin III
MKIREPINAFTHLFGALLSVVALIAMIIKVSGPNFSGAKLAAVLVFGISLILLYSMSATYHMVKASEKVIAFLRRLDHSMIFLLIAGSYAPFCLISLRGSKGWVLFSLVLGIGLIGILYKMIWFNAPRWISTLVYISMGWMAVFVISPLYRVITLKGILCLTIGGILYTIGGIIYATKPNFLRLNHLGFHEIFHVFILFGSFFHFLCVFKYII